MKKSEQDIDAASLTDVSHMYLDLELENNMKDKTLTSEDAVESHRKNSCVQMKNNPDQGPDPDFLE